MPKSILQEHAEVDRIKRGYFTLEEAAQFASLPAFMAAYPRYAGSMSTAAADLELERIRAVIAKGSK